MKASYPLVAVASCAMTLVGIHALGESDRASPASYSDFERELDAGKVVTLDIAGTTYRYRLRGEGAIHEATGPRATLVSIAAMRATKVTFEP